jgi:hypothetical protein
MVGVLRAYYAIIGLILAVGAGYLSDPEHSSPALVARRHISPDQKIIL